MQISNLIS